MYKMREGCAFAKKDTHFYFSSNMCPFWSIFVFPLLEETRVQETLSFSFISTVEKN